MATANDTLSELKARAAERKSFVRELENVIEAKLDDDQRTDIVNAVMRLIEDGPEAPEDEPEASLAEPATTELRRRVQALGLELYSAGDRQIVIDPSVEGLRVEYANRNPGDDSLECWLDYRERDNGRPAAAKARGVESIAERIIAGETVRITAADAIDFSRDNAQKTAYEVGGLIKAAHALCQQFDEDDGLEEVLEAARGKIRELCNALDSANFRQAPAAKGGAQ